METATPGRISSGGCRVYVILGMMDVRNNHAWSSSILSMVVTSIYVIYSKLHADNC